MKVFLDTNVVIDYLAKRQPFAEDANRMITLCCHRLYEDVNVNNDNKLRK